MLIQLDKIEHNPHRNMKRNPINKKQVSTLVASMKRNNVWKNVVVRKHPTLAGHYELAYGHHRLAAMKQIGLVEAEFSVEKIDDWGMYTAMVDENESQQSVTPELIYENIESGINYLEPIIRECETANEFEKVVPRGTTFCKPQAYGQVRKAVLDGEGLGVQFLSKMLPGESSTRRDNIQAVVDSHYAATKANAKAARAAAKKKKAGALVKAARAAKDVEEAEQLEAEAAALEAEAKKLADQAANLRDSGVSQELLLKFPHGKHMTEFASAVKRLKIPREKHAGLADMLLQRDSSANNYKREIEAWWFIASGKSRKQANERKRENFKKKHKSKTLDEFVASLAVALKEANKQCRALEGFTDSIQYPKRKASLHREITDLRLTLERLEEELATPVEDDAVNVTDAIPHLV